MSKTSTKDGDGYETVHYEISRGGYFTADKEVVMPNYLVRLPSQNDVIVGIDLEEKLNERVNGGDLDDGGDYARNFGIKMSEFELERSCVLLVDDGI